MTTKKTIFSAAFVMLFLLSSCFSGSTVESEPTLAPAVEEPTPEPEVVEPDPTAVPTEEPAPEPEPTDPPEVEDEPDSQSDSGVEGFATNPSGTFIITINEDGSQLIEVPDSGFLIEFSADYSAVDPADNEQIQQSIEAAIEDSLLSNQLMAQLAASGIKLYAINLTEESLSGSNPGTINVIRQQLPVELTLDQLVQANDSQLGDFLDLTSDITIGELMLGEQPAASFSYTANIPNGAGQTIEQLNNQYFVIDPNDASVAYIITAATPSDTPANLVDDLKNTAETFRILEN